MLRAEAEKILQRRPGETTKQAYRRRSKECHPDHGGSSEAFHELKQAYECLTFEEIRVDTRMSEDFINRRAKWRESTFQERVIKSLRSVGAVVFNCHGDIMQGHGWPDLWVGSPWWQGWLELKVDKGPLRRQQVVKLKQMRECHVPSYVLRYRNVDTMMTLEGTDGTVYAQRLRGSEGVHGKMMLEFLREANERAGYPVLVV